MADNAAWFSIALALTGVGGALTYLAWRSRGLAALLKGSGISLLPLALWSTGTLRLLGGIVDEVGTWASGLVFSPRVWIGLILAGVAVTLIVAGGRVARTRFASAGARKAVSGEDSVPLSGSAPTSRAKPSKPAQGGSAVDDDLADIEAILRNRGIS